MSDLRPGGSLPPDLAALLAREGLRIRGYEEITALSVEKSRRRTYRIELEDGTSRKGRVATARHRAERMVRWLPLLPAPGFSRLLACHGTATLETWCRGAPCAGDEASAEAAGALLAQVHEALTPERLQGDAPRLRLWRSELGRWTSELILAGRLDVPRARHLQARLRALDPRVAHWGLRHGDFCLENLIQGDAGPCCVDNATVFPGLLESDLAQTFRRWPMTPPVRAAFLRGYARPEVERSFARHEEYWMAAAALRAAAVRERIGAPDVEAALELLDRRVG